MKKKDQVVDPNSINSIVNTAVIKGDFNTESSIKFEGKLEGNLTTKSKLVLGSEGEIIGEIKCKSALISGRIKGKIIVTELLTLQSTAYIDGEIITNKIAIEPGAVFNGNCHMTDNNMPKNNIIEK